MSQPVSCSSNNCVCLPNDETRSEGLLFMVLSFIPCLLLAYLMFKFCIRPISLKFSYNLEEKHENDHLHYPRERKRLERMSDPMVKLRISIKAYSLCSMLSLIFVSITESDNYFQCNMLNGNGIYIGSFVNMVVYSSLFIVFIILWIETTLTRMVNYTELSHSIANEQKQHCDACNSTCCYYMGCCCIWDICAPCCGCLIKYISYIFEIITTLAIGASWIIYNPVGDVYTYSIETNGQYENLTLIKEDCLCSVSNIDFVSLYLTVGLVFCVIIAWILDGPCNYNCINKCCVNQGKDCMEIIVIICEYGGGYFFASTLFLLRCIELNERWRYIEENNHFYLKHLSFNDVFFIGFSIATFLWVIFSIRKCCRNSAYFQQSSDESDSNDSNDESDEKCDDNADTELTTLTEDVNQDHNAEEDQRSLYCF